MYSLSLTIGNKIHDERKLLIIFHTKIIHHCYTIENTFVYPLLFQDRQNKTSDNVTAINLINPHLETRDRR